MDLKKHIRSIPDYPKKGILFRDITTLIKDAKAFKYTNDKIIDLAKLIAPECTLKEIGLRPGEKLHEQLISSDESAFTYEFKDYFKILSPLNGWDACKSRIKGGEKVSKDFVYTSDKNQDWLRNESLKNWLNEKNNY